MSSLRHVTDDQPGFTRIRSGKNFRYLDVSGKPIRDAETLDRIRRLAIPPAYRNVWICAEKNGHLQATGRDARGRKQYRYHQDWVTRSKQRNFAHIIRFGEALPKIRRKVRKDLSVQGMPREKVLALVLAVMGRTLARVGNDAYARANNSYGLTTLRNRHFSQLPEGGLCLKFPGKSGQRQCYTLNDQVLMRLLRKCRDLPGQLLFQYLDEDGVVRPIDSGDVNDYLRQIEDHDLTAKDFRTWGGTLNALINLASLDIPKDADERTLASLEKSVVDSVSQILGNTPAVCRRSYIDPYVFKAWRQGRLKALREVRGARKLEREALKILRENKSSNEKVKAPR